jgi:type 1 glutamine amidotransferase
MKLLPLWLIVMLAPLTAWAGERTTDASRPKLVMLVAGQSYETERTLPVFAAQFLQPEFRVVILGGAMKNPGNRFDHIEELADADILLVSVWRRAPPQDQMALIRRHVEAGKPLVGIATASHAFALRKGLVAAEGSVAWPEWGARVIGGNYTGHHPIGLITKVTAADPGHPILRGVTLPFESKMELNQVLPLEPAAHAILTGTIEGRPSEPAAWTFRHYGNGRTFFTPLGHPEDFTHPAFQRLLLNGIRWAADRPIGPASPAAARTK